MTTPAIRHLRKNDPRFNEWIDRIGPLHLPVPPLREPYVALLESIAHQQLAGAAARAIWARVIGLFEDGVPSPKRLAEMSEADLRSAGLSRSKALATVLHRVSLATQPSSASVTAARPQIDQRLRPLSLAAASASSVAKP